MLAFLARDKLVVVNKFIMRMFEGDEIGQGNGR